MAFDALRRRLNFIRHWRSAFRHRRLRPRTLGHLSPGPRRADLADIRYSNDCCRSRAAHPPGSLREPLGIGTLANVLVIGLVVDATIDIGGSPTNSIVRVLCTLLGPIVVALGSGFILAPD